MLIGSWALPSPFRYNKQVPDRFPLTWGKKADGWDFTQQNTVTSSLEILESGHLFNECGILFNRIFNISTLRD
jgi:hypothetical protein